MIGKATTWLAGKALFGMANWLWIPIAIAALTGGLLWLQAREEADDKANQEIGATNQREGDLRETIERVERADNAEREITTDPDAARASCLRHSRTPENC